MWLQTGDGRRSCGFPSTSSRGSSDDEEHHFSTELQGLDYGTLRRWRTEQVYQRTRRSRRHTEPHGSSVAQNHHAALCSDYLLRRRA